MLAIVLMKVSSMLRDAAPCLSEAFGALYHRVPFGHGCVSSCVTRCSVGPARKMASDRAHHADRSGIQRPD